MPYVEVVLNAHITPEDARDLNAAFVELLATDLRKDPLLSVVRITVQADSLCRGPAAEADPGLTVVEAHITAATTTAQQRESFLAHTHRLLSATGRGTSPSYVIIHEHSPDAWGYGGQSQRSRLAPRPT